MAKKTALAIKCIKLVRYARAFADVKLVMIDSTCLHSEAFQSRGVGNTPEAGVVSTKVSTGQRECWQQPSRAHGGVR